MSLAVTSEEIEFRDTLRRFFEAVPPAEARRFLAPDAGSDPALWKRLVAELGLPGLAISESAGGQGFGPVERGIALAEMGRVLLNAPFFSSAVLAAEAVRWIGGPEEQREWLSRIASGKIASLAWLEDDGDWRAAAPHTRAVRHTDAWRITGAKQLVPDGCAAEQLLVVASSDEGQGLFAVDAAAAGVERAAVRTFDGTRKLATVVLRDAPGLRIGTPGAVATGLARALDEATVALCAEMVGGMERVLEAAVDYARTRYQFGRAIGSFQAIKHKCADILIDLECARSATRMALEAAEASDPELPLLASVAKAHCADAFFRAATENIQIHGGVGVTWEYDAQLYYRRAKADEVWLGDAAWHRARIAGILASPPFAPAPGATGDAR